MVNRSLRLRVRLARRAEEVYSRELRVLARRLVHQYLEAVPELAARLDPTPRRDGLFDDILGVLALGIASILGLLVTRAFNKMAAAVVKASSSIEGVTPSDTGIKDLIDRARQDNLLLVDKLHRGYAQAVKDIFEDPATFGMRVEDIKAKILERADITERHAELIARDQTLKLNAAITRLRMQNAGITKYRWSTSLDERVRPTHQE